MSEDIETKLLRLLEEVTAALAAFSAQKKFSEKTESPFSRSKKALIVHHAFNIIFANKAFAKLHGLRNPHELVGENIQQDFVPPDLDEWARKGTFACMVQMRRRADGRFIQVRVEGTKIAENGLQIVKFKLLDTNSKSRKRNANHGSVRATKKSSSENDGISSDDQGCRRSTEVTNRPHYF